MKGNEYYLLKNFSDKYWTTHRMMTPHIVGQTIESKLRREKQGKKPLKTDGVVFEQLNNIFGRPEWDWLDIFIIWGERDYAYRFTEEQANAIKEGLPKLRLRVEKK